MTCLLTPPKTQLAQVRRGTISRSLEGLVVQFHPRALSTFLARSATFSPVKPKCS
jgi:hypothetical protein